MDCATTQDTQSCVESFQRSYDLGNIVTYQPLDGNDVGKGLKIIFSNGHPCGNGPLSTIIHLTCNPTAGIGQPILISPRKRFESICDIAPVMYIWESHAAVSSSKYMVLTTIVSTLHRR
jgi:hypothetical protein